MSRAEILALIREIAEHEAELEARTVPYEARIDDKSMNHLRRSVTARYAEDLYERLDRAGVDMWFGESDRMAVKSATTEWRQSRGYDALRAAYRASIGEAAPSIVIDQSRDRARAAAEKREIERREAEAAATAERERLAAERRAKEAAEAAADERARLEEEKADSERRVKAAEEAARAAEQERLTVSATRRSAPRLCRSPGMRCKPRTNSTHGSSMRLTAGGQANQRMEISSGSTN
jgi:hypothetical protein